MRPPVYLDHAATTPLRPEVRAAMEPYLSERFGNPSSTHVFGREARRALEDARGRLAEALGVAPDEIVFTRGGTEANNLALLGRLRAAEQEGEVPAAVVSAVEHPAVLQAAAAAEAKGARVERLSVRPDGSVDLEALDASLSRGAAVVSVMWVNNEVGTVLPVVEVGRRCREAGVPFHTDAVQAVGKVPVRPGEASADLLTVAGHKIYGPRAMGALVVRRGVELVPLLFGGGQEGGLRPGTPDVAGAVGLAEAVVLAVAEQEAEARRLAGLRDRLEASLREGIPDLVVRGAEGPRAPHILNVGIGGVEGDVLLSALDLEGIAASGGSACASGAGGGSHVLEALYGPGTEGAALRFSLGRLSGPEEVERAAEVTVRVVRHLRGG